MAYHSKETRLNYIKTYDGDGVAVLVPTFREVDQLASSLSSRMPL